MLPASRPLARPHHPELPKPNRKRRSKPWYVLSIHCPWDTILKQQFDEASDEDDDDDVEEVVSAKKTRAPAKKAPAKAPAKTTSRAKAKSATPSTQSQLPFSRGGKGKTSNPIELSDEDD
jgi:BRCT domain type II-containing protein